MKAPRTNRESVEVTLELLRDPKWRYFATDTLGGLGSIIKDPRLQDSVIAALELVASDENERSEIRHRAAKSIPEVSGEEKRPNLAIYPVIGF